MSSTASVIAVTGCAVPYLVTAVLGKLCKPAPVQHEVQRRAQAELDAVVGPNRLPDHNDREALPYINAILKEALRWQNVLPLGAPHQTYADMTYDG
ncbi:cytochrome P450 [Dichomitus squalens]|uniref:Cytochrome P450 n=1 Tax=Dichomitus squalens TaxID=114155 RepID=A0A4Q9Q453_9APHY|nr:cytochrome P450 [Dichomitus squalens]